LAAAEITAIAGALVIEATALACNVPSLERGIGALVARMEKMSPLKAAFAHLTSVAAVVNTDVSLVAFTRGFAEMLPHAMPELPPGAVTNQAPLPVTVGRRHCNLVRRVIGPGRVLIELTPLAQLIADDDLDAFGVAVASGRTGFRFDAGAVAGSAGLATLNAA